MRRMIIRLDQPTREALGRLAIVERRQPSEQAAYIIERALATHRTDETWCDQEVRDAVTASN